MNIRYSIQSKVFSQPVLPIFVNPKNKYLVGFIVFIILATLYLTANHFHFFKPQLLPFSWVDSVVPFWPYTVWVYTSEYIFFIAVYMTCKDLVNLNKYVYSIFVLWLVSIIVFWIWPTTFPRELFALPEDLNSLTYLVFSGLRMIDTPANCCPSLHVSSVYLSSFIFLDDQRRKFPFFFLWATAIAASTLTTKQHYLIDVVTGFLMAGLTYWIFHKHVGYKLPPSRRQAKR